MRGYAQAALLFAAMVAVGAHASALPQPNLQAHERFLIGDYEPSRPSVMVFKDPHCGFCIAAIPKLEQLKGYNVFLFWSPIFGQRSVERINKIFQCSSPVGETVLHHVGAREAPACGGPVDEALLAVNQAMVDAYRIRSVPAYYFQGVRFSAQHLLERQGSNPPINGVSVDWARYAPAKVRSRPDSGAIALLLRGQDAANAANLSDYYRPQYVVVEASDATGQGYRELRMLLGLEASGESLLISSTGEVRPLQP